jgi:UDP-2,3-diacylglucosamine pyrophosphatase LpxH
MGKTLKFTELKEKLNTLFGIGGLTPTARCETHDLNDLKIVVFSDLHRGKGNGSDDFRRSQSVYAGALAYYYSQGYRVFLLGDVEELWEVRTSQLGKIVSEYRSIYEMEAKFHQSDPARYLRFYGNHDLPLYEDWGQHLDETFRKLVAEQKPTEALKLTIHKDNAVLGNLLFAHGDQANTYGKLSLFFVKNLWAPIQNLTRIGSGVPSKNYYIRSEVESKMAAWLGQLPDTEAPTALIIGHTHHPVFEGENHIQFLKKQLEKLTQHPQATPEAISKLTAELAFIERATIQNGSADINYTIKEDETSAYSIDDIIRGRNSYFNTGCCSFWDGDITCMEINDAKLSLIRWSDQNETQITPTPEVEYLSHLSRQTLSSNYLEAIFSKQL